MKVGELLSTVTDPVMVRIIRGKEELYAGYKGMLPYEYEDEGMPDWMEDTVKGFAAVPEIRDKHYREKGLMEPLLSEELPQYSFSDLTMTLYYTIKI